MGCQFSKDTKSDWYIFSQKSTNFKEIIVFCQSTSINCQKVQKSYFQKSIFLSQKWSESGLYSVFHSKLLLLDHGLRNWHLFTTLILKKSKIMPTFWRLDTMISLIHDEIWKNLKLDKPYCHTLYWLHSFSPYSSWQDAKVWGLKQKRSWTYWYSL